MQTKTAVRSGLVSATILEKMQSLSSAEKIVCAFLMAVLTGACAQARFYTPVTPVPFTGQVFAVLFSAVLLGRIYGAFSQTLYVGLGMAGVPWFTGGLSGSFWSPTNGYLAGFVAAALLVGALSQRRGIRKSFFRLFAVLLAGIAVIYSLGSLYFMMITGAGLQKTLLMTAYPFIAFDIIKALGVAFLARLINRN